MVAAAFAPEPHPARSAADNRNRRMAKNFFM
jgi:hypothetical protein